MNEFNNRNYKTSYRKNNYRLAFFVLITICLILTTITVVNIVSDFKINAMIEDQAVTYEISFVYHTVEAGESLSYIAGKYIGEYPGSFYEYQALICQKNGIANANYIVVGDVIQVPIYNEVITSNNGK